MYFLKLATGYLDNLAALKADQVMMVLMFVFVLVVFGAVPEIDLSRQSCIAYYLHRTVYGGKADFGVFLSDQIVKVINRRVFLSLEKYIQNLLSLTAMEHAVAFKVLSENGLR